MNLSWRDFFMRRLDLAVGDSTEVCDNPFCKRSDQFGSLSMTEYEFTGRKYPDIQREPELTHWETFQNHREIVTSFITRSISVSTESLCVLGAGFCNDLELSQLAREFSKVSLVDLSEQDIAIGLRQQNQSDSNVFENISGCDVTGIDGLLLEYKEEPSERLLVETADKLEKYRPPLAQYDCVASTCLLSQLLCHATECIGDDHPKFVEFLQLVRRRHVEIMLELLHDQGAGILITDFVSSLSLPDLLTTDDLKTTVQTAIRERNYLHGLNPQMVAKVFEHDNVRPQLKGIRVSEPWRWALPDRMYACFAIIFHKK